LPCLRIAKEKPFVKLIKTAFGRQETELSPKSSASIFFALDKKLRCMRQEKHQTSRRKRVCTMSLKIFSGKGIGTLLQNHTKIHDVAYVTSLRETKRISRLQMD